MKGPKGKSESTDQLDTVEEKEMSGKMSQSSSGDLNRVYRTSSFNDLSSLTISSPERRVAPSKGRLTKEETVKNEMLLDLMDVTLPRDIEAVQRQIVNHVEYTLARTRFDFDTKACYQASAHSVRDRLIESWNDTQQYFDAQSTKKVYYLSLEFLIGRSLRNAIMNLGLSDNYAEALKQLGYSLEDLYEEEQDAALGNGGLGRLAACFLDSMASTNIPGWGYGIRYKYGMFRQKFNSGYQEEFPDYWLNDGNPWEIPRIDVQYPIRFYGDVVGPNAQGKFRWEGGEIVQACAYDNPIPGYDTYNTINLRLWSANPSKEFDLRCFNEGDFVGAINSRNRAEDITAVLYPNDSSDGGKELRLKQEYFFVSATVQDVLHDFKSKWGNQWSELPNQVAFQLNDTHPAITVAELMRILIDDENLDYEQAFDITVKTCAYTNHTVLPEALEKWSVGLMTHLLPRHMKIIYDINFHFLKIVEAKYPGDFDRLARMSIIEEGGNKQVRMANLAVVGSHSVNGVAQIHSELVKSLIFPDFYDMWPEKFQNKTNGVTPRRWVHQCNEKLSNLMSNWLCTDEWVIDMTKLEGLKEHAGNPHLQRQWAGAKLHAKEVLASYIGKANGLVVDPHAMFDVQVKRIHEYKRQLMNILGIIYRYDTIRNMSSEAKKRVVPRVCIFGGKAAPGYIQAKRIIKLINNVADVVNKDPLVGHLLKVVYLANYNVSLAEMIVPASDLSQHISTAGMEASGTSNMKFAMNGGLILGTMDGANIEIGQEIGFENMFIFGALAHEVDGIRHNARYHECKIDARLTRVLELIRSDTFGPAGEFYPILDALQPGNDHYILTHDFPLFLDAQESVDECWKDQKDWQKRSIMSTAGSAKFSSDRTIGEYAKDIWGIEPCARPVSGDKDPRSPLIMKKRPESQ